MIAQSSRPTRDPSTYAHASASGVSSVIPCVLYPVRWRRRRDACQPRVPTRNATQRQTCGTRSARQQGSSAFSRTLRRLMSDTPQSSLQTARRCSLSQVKSVCSVPRPCSRGYQETAYSPLARGGLQERPIQRSCRPEPGNPPTVPPPVHASRRRKRSARASSVRRLVFACYVTWGAATCSAPSLLTPA